LFPGTSLLIAAGALMPTGALSYSPVVAGAILGAVFGDAVSYWVGRRFGQSVARVWPFTRHPELLPRGIRFFAKYGGLSVFIGRFFGPVRAVIPLAAGIMQMPSDRFWIANVTSALVWAPLLILVGDGIGQLAERLIGRENLVALVFGAFILFGIGSVAWALSRAGRPRT
jgi:membrane protein DedA with SNARE-associated domain